MNRREKKNIQFLLQKLILEFEQERIVPKIIKGLMDEVKMKIKSI